MRIKKPAILPSVFGIALGLALSLSATAQDIQGSVITVGQLLKIDNAHALQKAQEEALKNGVLQGPKQGAQKVEAPLPVWTVRSIFGSESRKFADLQVDVTSFQGTVAGQNIAMCRVEAIENACVALTPISKKVRKGSCPAKVCWTGNELSAELHPVQTKTADVGFKLMPTPLPVAPLPIPQGSASPANDASKAPAR